MGDLKIMKKLRAKIIVTATLVLCLALTGLGTAYATKMFGLKDQIMGDKSQITILVPVENGTFVETLIPSDTISLQGYAESKEYQAATEWNTFLDQNLTRLVSKVGNGPTGLEEKYVGYSVYTQEMADKLEAVTAKYGLKLHTSIRHFYDEKELSQVAGKDIFLGETNKVEGGYIYDDGTFRYDGGARLSNGISFAYQLGYCRKGVFDAVYLNIGNANDYKEWSYKTAGGVVVTLAVGPHSSLVIANLDKAFVTINVLPEISADFEPQTGYKISEADLETFADSIDFSKLD
jgi:hypothetical protein